MGRGKKEEGGPKTPGKKPRGPGQWGSNQKKRCPKHRARLAQDSTKNLVGKALQNGPGSAGSNKKAAFLSIIKETKGKIDWGFSGGKERNPKKSSSEKRGRPDKRNQDVVTGG